MKPIKKFFLVTVTGTLLAGCAHQATITTPKLAILDQQIATNPENAQAYSNRGYTLALLGQKSARADLRKAVALKNTGPMHNGAGWAYFNLGDYATALHEWQVAAELSQKKAHYDYYSLALGYWGVGDVAHTLENYALAVEREPRFGDIKYLNERTAEWTLRERLAMQQMYALWGKTWRAQ